MRNTKRGVFYLLISILSLPFFHQGNRLKAQCDNTSADITISTADNSAPRLRLDYNCSSPYLNVGQSGGIVIGAGTVYNKNEKEMLKTDVAFGSLFIMIKATDDESGIKKLEVYRDEQMCYCSDGDYVTCSQSGLKTKPDFINNDPDTNKISGAIACREREIRIDIPNANAEIGTLKSKTITYRVYSKNFAGQTSFTGIKFHMVRLYPNYVATVYFDRIKVNQDCDNGSGGDFKYKIYVEGKEVISGQKDGVSDSQSIQLNKTYNLPYVLSRNGTISLAADVVELDGFMNGGDDYLCPSKPRENKKCVSNIIGEHSPKFFEDNEYQCGKKFYAGLLGKDNDCSATIEYRVKFEGTENMVFFDHSVSSKLVSESEIEFTVVAHHPYTGQALDGNISLEGKIIGKTNVPFRLLVNQREQKSYTTSCTKKKPCPPHHPDCEPDVCLGAKEVQEVLYQCGAAVIKSSGFKDLNISLNHTQLKSDKCVCKD